MKRDIPKEISSRDIEYKAKDFDTKEWITGFLFIDQSGANYILDTNNDGDNGVKCRFRLIDHNTKRQFAYCNDVNGDRIYEGDILHKDGYWDVYVQFIDTAFYVIPFDEVQRVNLAPSLLSTYITTVSRIVGNMFDNPKEVE